MKIDFEFNVKKTLLVVFVLSCLAVLGFALNAGYSEYNRTQLEKYNLAKYLAEQCLLIPGALTRTTQSSPIFGNGIEVTCEYYSDFHISKRP